MIRLLFAIGLEIIGVFLLFNTEYLYYREDIFIFMLVFALAFFAFEIIFKSIILFQITKDEDEEDG